MKILVFILACFLGSSAFAADVWRPGYQYHPNGGGTQIWFGPGGQMEVGAAARGRTVFSQAANGVRAVESGAVALADGRALTLTATRSISNSALWNGVSAFARGPYGLAAAIAIPFVAEWIAGDNQQNVRVNPTATGVEKKDSNSVCDPWTSAVPTFPYPAQYLASGFAILPINSIAEGNVPVVNAPCRWGYMVLADAGYVYQLSYGYTTAYPGGWLPASMDDIAPYMTPRTPSVALVPYLLERGITFPATEESVTGPSPALAPVPESKRTTEYAKPADIVSSPVVTNGNPFGLPSNTPTVTSSSTGSKSLSPTSSSTTGPNPSPTPHTPVVTPTKTETVSNYDPATDKTTSTTTTSQDAARQETTTTTITNITNTTNTSTVTNTITNITNITNITKNEPIGPPIEDVKNDPKPDSDPRSECEKNPDVIGCAQFGTPTSDEPLKKETSAVTVTSMPFAGSAACPAALNFNVSGHAYAFSYQPMCDKLAILKYLFLAMAGFIAAWVVASTFKV